MEAIQSQIKKIFGMPVPFFQVFPVRWIFAFVVLFSIDIVSKVIVTENLNFYLAPHQIGSTELNYSHSALYNGIDRVDILGENGEWFKLRLVFNDRFVFGAGPSAPVLGFFLTLSAVIFLFFYRWHNPDLGNPFAWLLVFSGAMGNLIDKMFVKSMIDRSWTLSIFPREGHVSGVVDFFECIWFGWKGAEDILFLNFLSWESWPTFNIADSFVVVGVILLVITVQLSATQEQESGR
jgi:signal peptidase II